MNATLSLPRTDHNEKWPVIEKLEVPVLKRSRFLGVGGMNLKKLMAEAGKHAVCPVMCLSSFHIAVLVLLVIFSKVLTTVNCHYTYCR